VTIIEPGAGILVPILTGTFGLLAALAGAGFAHLAATRREARTRLETEQREERNRQADIDRERLHDLRAVVDEAIVALMDLWVIYNDWRAAIPRGKGETPLPPGVPVGVSVSQARPPDRETFMGAHLRLSEAHTKLTLRLDRDDALLSPITTVISQSQTAWNVIVLEDDPYTPDRTDEDKRRIRVALFACASAYPDVTKAAKRRFAPAPLPGTLRRYALNLDTRPARTAGRDPEDVLPALRRTYTMDVGNAIGPHPKTGMVRMTGMAETKAEFRADVLRRLEEASDDWPDYLDMPDSDDAVTSA
jgi:hypothetical protein